MDEIKKATIRALMSDESLIAGLVLKGGNALQLAYDITSRGSIDIDFSMEKDFSKDEFDRLQRQLSYLLNDEFNKMGLIAYNVLFKEKPKSGSIPEWKGYQLEFKLISVSDYEKYKGDDTQLNNHSLKLNGQSTKYTVDISSYEYIEKSTRKDVDGVVLRVYTPEMLVIEKIRALCQTMSAYKEIVHSARNKQRARDVYDIWNLFENFPNMVLSKELFEEIFKAKRVPLNFINNIEELREHNRENWKVVEETIDIQEKENLEEYDYYFDFLKKIIDSLPFKVQ